MNSSYLIALDAGGSSVKSARVTLQHDVLASRNDAIDTLADRESILGTLARIIESHIAGAQGEPAGVAFSFPGPFDYSNGICLIQHRSHSAGVKYGALYGVNVRDALREKLNRPALPIVFRNDGEAAILGEACHGAGKGLHRLIGITLGTGLGSAFLVDGVPQTTGEGVPAEGWLYPLSYRDATADDYFSTRGLLAHLQHAGCHFNSINAAALDEDAATHNAFAAWGTELGAFLAPFAAAFKPDALIALGGITHAWERFGPALQAALPVPAMRGALGEDAALLGAADLLLTAQS
jgi:glucokinase